AARRQVKTLARSGNCQEGCPMQLLDLTGLLLVSLFRDRSSAPSQVFKTLQHALLQRCLARVEDKMRDRDRLGCGLQRQVEGEGAVAGGVTAPGKVPL